MVAAKEEIVLWVNTYTKDLFSYAIAKVKQKEVAEDLVQDAFLSAYQSYENFEGKSNVKTWLFAILKHKIADYYRSKYKQQTEVDSDLIDKLFDENHRWKRESRPTNWGDEKALLDDPEFVKTFNDCFDKLPQKWCYALQFKFLEKHDSKLICSKLEISSTNFWQIMHRAKLQLRSCLELRWFNG